LARLSHWNGSKAKDAIANAVEGVASVSGGLKPRPVADAEMVEGGCEGAAGGGGEVEELFIAARLHVEEDVGVWVGGGGEGEEEALVGGGGEGEGVAAGFDEDDVGLRGGEGGVVGVKGLNGDGVFAGDKVEVEGRCVGEADVVHYAINAEDGVGVAWGCGGECGKPLLT
jgi:hypothetical protein